VILAITPGDGRDLRPWIEALVAAGLQGLLIREPGATADQLRSWLRAAPIPLVAISDRNPHAGLARVHAHAGAPVVAGGGASCHSAAEVDAALSAGAAYALLSPVWAPSSKPDDRPTLGPDRFLRIAAGRPVFALGGVTPERHHALMRAGAHGSAVLGGIFSAPDPDAAADRLRQYDQRSSS
jgi:thiamine-phosphate pyrophosphorylase